ncbi:MAG: ATP-binding protein [Candidatus Marinimicrobia bacterium]|nr:ATP-binding protein [Candidatus Neomarinimicrobiota bacterium]
MKEIVVISGKGGTGKTSLTASFSFLGGDKMITADCDVDAADMHLLLEPDFAESEDFYSGKMAFIDKNQCTNCGSCAAICRFDAIIEDGNVHRIIELNCEGCGYCYHVCPVDAISMIDNLVGKWYKSKIKTGSFMVHAKLGIGAENSGKLVAKVKQEAKALAEQLGKELVLVDGSPGIGCPVISSLSGANLVVLVAEPSISGIHDLKRVIQLIQKFQIPSCCIINKADINEKNTLELMEFLNRNSVKHIGNIDYNENFTKAMTEGKTIMEYSDKGLADKVQTLWNDILKIL